MTKVKLNPLNLINELEHRLGSKYKWIYARSKLPSLMKAIKASNMNFKDPLLEEYTVVDGKEFFSKQYLYLKDIQNHGLIDIMQDDLTMINKHIDQNLEIDALMNTKTEAMIRDTGASSSEYFYSLSVPYINNMYLKSDKDFFKWFAKDESGNIYFLDNYTAHRIDYADNAVKKAAGNFNEMLHKLHGEDIKNWFRTILHLSKAVSNDSVEIDTDNYRGRSPLHNDKDISYIDILHSEIPKSVLNKLFIKITTTTYKEDNKPATRVTDIGIRRSPSSERGVDPTDENVAEMFAEIVPNLERDEFITLKRFSNDSSIPAIFSCPFPAYDKAKLPKVWQEYLKHRFTVDTAAQVYRVAKFLTSVIDATNESRQALCLAGVGNDGKSFFCNVVCSGFNNLIGCSTQKSKFAMDASVDMFEAGKTQIGLADRMDARLLYVPDVGKIKDFLNTDIFKAITGNDPVTADIKYRASVSKKMTGTKFMLATNNKIYIDQAYIETRIIPLYFSPLTNQEQAEDSRKLKEALIESFNDFLAWCVRYAKDTDEKRGWMNTEATEIFSSDKPDAPIQEVWERLQDGTHQRFFYKKSEDYAQELNDLYEDITAQLKIEADPESKYEFGTLRVKAANSAEYITGDPLMKKEFLSFKSPVQKGFIKFLKEKYNTTDYQSNGKRGLKGIKINNLSPQEWANTANDKPPKKSSRSSVDDDYNSLDRDLDI